MVMSDAIKTFFTSKHGGLNGGLSLDSLTGSTPFAWVSTGHSACDLPILDFETFAGKNGRERRC
jgi:hypothetical protein